MRWINISCRSNFGGCNELINLLVGVIESSTDLQPIFLYMLDRSTIFSIFQLSDPFFVYVYNIIKVIPKYGVYFEYNLFIRQT